MILGYIRCSTSDQAKDDRSSLQTQTDVIEGFARTRGADKYGVQIFTDAGVSGATKLAVRPAGADLLASMKPGDTVIASKLDRMFRSASDAIDMFEVFKAAGVDLVLFDISNEPVSTGVGKLIMTILAAVADMERIRIKERTAEGRKAAKAKGRAVGTVPFGYQEGRPDGRVGDRTRRRVEAARLMRDFIRIREFQYAGDFGKQLFGRQAYESRGPASRTRRWRSGAW
jgi:putative DNA-invertase from lambdoid prophage Rac